jgi:MFS transporter, PAT family, beta-lactamase induction signal transducer AmpG
LKLKVQKGISEKSACTMKANNTIHSEVIAAHTPVHPSVFTLLMIPFGIMTGYVTVALAYLFAKEGISVEKIAALVAAILLPQIFRFIWAPLIDTTLSLKKWYLIANVVSAFGILATGILPIKESSLPLLTFIVIFSNFTVTFLSMSTSGLMAHDVPEEKKRTSCWFLSGRKFGRSRSGRRGRALAGTATSGRMDGCSDTCLYFFVMLCWALLFAGAEVNNSGISYDQYLSESF